MDTPHDFTRIWCSGCGHSVAVPVRCHKRFCPICARGSAYRARRRLNWLVAKIPKAPGQNWKFLTLTIRSQRDLEPMIQHLLHSFRKMRSRKLWKSHVTGGMYTLEVTHSEKGWHAHLHILAMMNYFPQFVLSKLWNTISGSPIVDIRKAPPAALVKYLTAYMSKWEIPATNVAEAELVLRDKRLWSAFGIAHDLNVEYKPEPVLCPHCNRALWMSEHEMEFRLAHYGWSG